MKRRSKKNFTDYSKQQEENHSKTTEEDPETHSEETEEEEDSIIKEEIINKTIMNPEMQTQTGTITIKTGTTRTIEELRTKKKSRMARKK